MSKDLLILCHPDPKELKPRESENIELSDSCKRNAQRLGVWMARQNLLPQQVTCGPGVPSRTAAEKSCKAAGLNAQLVRSSQELGRPTTESILDVIKGLDSQFDVALVVVKSSVAALFRDQLDGGLSADEPLDPSSTTLMHFRLGCDWDRSARGCGDLVQAIDGGGLPELFPFPDHRGPNCGPGPPTIIANRQ